MSVPEQTPYVEYTANGSTTNFALEFDCDKQEYLIVTLDEVEPPVGSWNLTGNSVVFLNAPSNGVKVEIKRNTPFSRTTDYQTYNNSFLPPAVNKDFDLIWWKLQELGVADWTLENGLKQEILDRIAADEQMLDYILNQDNALKADYIERDSKLKDYIDQMIALVTGDPSFQGIFADFVIDGDKNQKQLNDNNKNQFLLIENHLTSSTDYIDDALDAIKSELVAKGSMSGASILIPRGIWRISRSHDLSVTGLRIVGDGGRYASRIVADTNGDYSAGYVLKIAPTSGQSITGGSGLEKVTIDLNEAAAVGLIYQGAYDVSAFDRAEIINGHKDFPCAIIEPTSTGTVIQTLKLDTSGFSKKSVGGTGYVVEVRKAQECLIINSKMFGSPSNNATKGSVPLLLEDVRGIQIVGGGFANSETNCIHIYAKTRNTTHVSIIGPTFEGYKAKAIKTWGDPTTADPAVTHKVSRLICMNERLITPAAGLLDGADLTFSTIYASNADVELKAGSTNNTIHTYNRSKVIDSGTYNEIIESPSSLNSNLHVSSRSQAVILKATPQFVLGVVGRTGNYSVRWDASASVDTGMAFMTPNRSRPIRLLDDRLGFFGTSPVTQRTSPAVGATDSQKIAAIILGLEQLGLFKAPT